MKLCDEHWKNLRAAIEARGLSRFVTNGGEAAAAKFVSEVKTGGTAESFDPLMGAFMRIFENALRIAPVLLTSEGCPLCDLNLDHELNCETEGCKFSFDSWIEKSADEMLGIARERGLLGEA